MRVNVDRLRQRAVLLRALLDDGLTFIIFA
jgi:hypothetical protein